LHIHGKYSRATSKSLDLFNLEKYARLKGVNLLGTGDFTHPEWIKHLKENLSEDGTGVLKSKTGFPFLLQTEISLIYTQGRGRKVHNIVLAPSFDVVDQITEYLLSRGRIDYDGRPIFKIPCPEFIESLRNISDKIEVIPAHCMTSHFGVFGSCSGFDSLKECFLDQTKHVHAVETGISADPPMLWRLKENVNLVSFSDIHSFWPWRLGRECTIFDFEKLSYDNLINSIRTGDRLVSTIETAPEYGKYHWDGHRNCGIVFSPEESRKHNRICPRCKKPLTIGVEYRIEELAKEEKGFRPKNAKPFSSLIPLSECLAFVLGKAVSTKTVWIEYNKLVNDSRSEFEILMNSSRDELLKLTGEKVVDIIIKNRSGGLKIKPGYDGVYGHIVLDDEVKEEDVTYEFGVSSQKSLSDF